MEEAIADLLGNDEKALLDTLQILDPVVSHILENCSIVFHF